MSQPNMGIGKITIGEMKDEIVDQAELGLTLMFHGPSGVGKSEGIYQAADVLVEKRIKELEREAASGASVARIGEIEDEVTFHKDNVSKGAHVIDIRLALETQSSLKGIAIPKEDKELKRWVTTMAYADRWLKDSRWVGVIFFDELTSAMPSLQVIAYQALNDHCIDQMKFPKGAAVVGAGNRVIDGGHHHGLLKPVANRVVQYEIYADAKEFGTWGLENNMHPTLVAWFLSGDGTAHLHTQPPYAAFASPRSWFKMVSPNLYKFDQGLCSDRQLNNRIMGAVGQDSATAFQTYNKVGRYVTSVESVVKGQASSVLVRSLSELEAELENGYSCPTEQGATYYLMYGVVSHFIAALQKPEYTEKQFNEELCNFGHFCETVVRGNQDLVVSIWTTLLSSISKMGSTSQSGVSNPRSVLIEAGSGKDSEGRSYYAKLVQEKNKILKEAENIQDLNAA